MITRKHWIGLVMALALGASSQAAQVVLKVAAVNGVPVPGGPQANVTVHENDLLTAEVQLSGWSGQLLRGYQVQLDPAGFTSGASGALALVAAGSTIENGRSDYVYAGLSPDPADQVSFAVVDTGTPGHRWSAGVFSPAASAADSGSAVYLATAELQVSAGATGTFVVSFSSNSALRNNAAPAAPITPLSFAPASITVTEAVACNSIQDCADLNGDNIRDDNCIWWGCEANLCAGADIIFADMGGQFGACPPDGTADVNDRFQALNCFADMDPLGGPFLCEDAPPVAFNVDGSGQFGSCDPDGVCDVNDAFAALNAFSDDTLCSCPLDGGPMPAVQTLVVGEVSLTAAGDRKHIRPGEELRVEVFFDQALPDVRGYQLHLEASGGSRGQLELIDIEFESRKERALPVGNWQAFNTATGQMAAGLDTAGVSTLPGAYLATFTYRASADAEGVFAIDILHDDHDPQQRTFLIPTPPNGKIAVTAARGATVVVERTLRELDTGNRR